MNLIEFHQQFPDSCRWRVTSQGVEVEGAGLIRSHPGQMDRARVLTDKYEHLYAAASREFGVPMELLIACSLTESAVKNPETCFRQEPGFVSDAATPHRISAGFCQLLISTAGQSDLDPSPGQARHSIGPAGPQHIRANFKFIMPPAAAMIRIIPVKPSATSRLRPAPLTQAADPSLRRGQSQP
jgi:hypothetical protein